PVQTKQGFLQQLKTFFTELGQTAQDMDETRIYPEKPVQYGGANEILRTEKSVVMEPWKERNRHKLFMIYPGDTTSVGHAVVFKFPEKGPITLDTVKIVLEKTYRKPVSGSEGDSQGIRFVIGLPAGKLDQQGQTVIQGINREV